MREIFDANRWQFDEAHRGSRAPIRRAIKATARRTGLLPALRRLRQTLEPVDARRARAEAVAIHRFLAETVEPGWLCVDVGASEGKFVDDMLAAGASVVAFEPLPDFAARLRERLPAVDVRAVALDSEPGEAEYVYIRDRAATSGLRSPVTAASETICVTKATLDDEIKAVPQLIKLDVEGAELRVLEGATRILESRPILIFENSETCGRYGYTPADLYRFLTSRGYEIRDLHGSQPLPLLEYERLVRDGVRENFLAR